MPEVEEVMSLRGVLDVGLHVTLRDEIKSIKNATARIGYVIVEADSKVELEKRLKNLYNMLVINDDQGINHIIHRKLTGA
jgi:hypothetical protein